MFPFKHSQKKQQLAPTFVASGKPKSLSVWVAIFFAPMTRATEWLQKA
jgi:hypothetical protein